MRCWCVCIVLNVLVIYGRSQTLFHGDSLNAITNEVLTVHKLAGDTLASSFLIVISSEVKLHKHQTHSEHVVVLEGEGLMTLGEKQFPIKKHDVVFIPKDTYHAVKLTSKIPLKVISIQAPKFDGADRIFKDQTK